MMIKCTALKIFQISHDGFTAIPVAVGDEIEVPDSLFDGLLAEKFISPIIPPPLLDIPVEPAPQRSLRRSK